MDVAVENAGSNCPSVTPWAKFQSESAHSETRVRAMDFANCMVLFVLQGPTDRVASWVEAKRSVDTLSGHVEFDTRVLFGDRDDIWTRLIARRAADMAKKDVVVGVSLSRECTNEIGARDVSTIVSDYLKATFAL